MLEQWKAGGARAEWWAHPRNGHKFRTAGRGSGSADTEMR